MTLTPTDLCEIAGLVLAFLWIAARDDVRVGRWIRETWSRTVGAWCARRRMRIRVPPPDEHSAGIMVARRDVNVGNWT